MKIKLFDRAKCIGIAKELKIKSGLTEEEVDKIPTGDLLHFSKDLVFSGTYFPVAHIQYDGDDNSENDNIIGYNIVVDRYGTSYYVPKEFVAAVDEKATGDVEIVDLSHKPVIEY